MASVHHLLTDALTIKQEIVDKYDEYADGNRLLYFSALRIQRTWRGYVVRKMVKKWHKAATIIQRFVRGWLARLHLPERYKEFYDNMCGEYYYKQATIIQAAWRGYWIRNTVRLREILAERRALQEKADAMRKLVQDAFDALRRQNELAEVHEEQAKMGKVLEGLFNYHHLLRTRQIEGVLSIHNSLRLSSLETILKSCSYSKFMKKYNRIRYPQGSKFGKESRNNEEHQGFDLTPKTKRPPYERLLLTRD